MSVSTADGLFIEAQAAYATDDFDAALEQYNAAIELDSTKAAYYMHRAACHLKLKHFAETIADASSCIKLEPKNHTAYLQKGIASFSVGELETALSALKSAELYGNKQTDLWLRKVRAELTHDAKLVASSIAGNASAPASPAADASADGKSKARFIPASQLNTLPPAAAAVATAPLSMAERVR